MTHDFAANDDESGSFSDAEVARVTLELDRQITRYRRAGAMHHLVEGRPLSLPVKPTRIELAVLTALAHTYGPAVVTHRDFTPGARLHHRMRCRGPGAARAVGRAAG